MMTLMQSMLISRRMAQLSTKRVCARRWVHALSMLTSPWPVPPGRLMQILEGVRTNAYGVFDLNSLSESFIHCEQM